MCSATEKKYEFISLTDVPFMIVELLSLVISDDEAAVADTFVVAFLTFVSVSKKRKREKECENGN